MRFITLLLMLVLAAASAAPAKTARVQCEDGSTRCDSAVGTRNDSAIDVARHRPSGPQRRIETGEKPSHAPARVSSPSRKAPAERERTGLGPANLNDASGDPGFVSTPAAIAGASEASGLGPWARVLAIVMAAAGALSLIVARMADA